MLRSLLWASVGVGGQQVLRLVVVLVLARILSPADFGIVAIAQTILSFADVLQQMGLGSALVQTDNLTKRLERSVTTAVLVSSAALAGVVWLLTPWFAVFFQTPELPRLMPWLLAAFMISSLNNPALMLLNREMRFRELAIAQLVTYLLGYGTVSVGLALAGFSYWSMVWGTLAQVTIFFLICHWLRPVWPTLRPNWQELKGIMGFGGGMLLSQFLNNLARRGDNMVVSATMGSAPLGLYSRAYSLMDMANQLFGTVFYRVFFPRFSEGRRKNQPREKRVEVFIISHFFIALFMVPISALISLCAPEIIWVLLGPQWSAAGPVLAILGGAMYFRLAYKVSGAFTAAEGAVYRYAIVQAVYAAIVFAGAWVGSRYGLIGIAWAVTFALLVHHIMQALLALSTQGGSFGRFIQVTSIPILAGLVAYIAVEWLHSAYIPLGYSALLTVPIISSAYFLLYGVCCLLLFKVFPPPEYAKIAIIRQTARFRNLRKAGAEIPEDARNLDGSR